MSFDIDKSRILIRIVSGMSTQLRAHRRKASADQQLCLDLTHELKGAIETFDELEKKKQIADDCIEDCAVVDANATLRKFLVEAYPILRRHEDSECLGPESLIARIYDVAKSDRWMEQLQEGE